MTEIKIGPYHLRGHENPTCWQLFVYRRAKKSGRVSERTIGWYGRLSHALSRALEADLAEADAQSIAELRERLEDFRKLVEKMDD